VLEAVDVFALRHEVPRRLPIAGPTLVESPESAIERDVRRLLQLRVERRLHAQAGLIERVGAVLLLEYLADLFDEVGRDRHGGSGLSLEHERTLGGLGGFLRRDVTLFGHAPKDVVVAAIDVLFGIAERAQARGRRNDCDD